MSDTSVSAFVALLPRSTETMMGSREKPMEISVKSGLYQSMSPSAPMKVTATCMVLCSWPTKSRSMMLTSFESAEI